MKTEPHSRPPMSWEVSPHDTMGLIPPLSLDCSWHLLWGRHEEVTTLTLYFCSHKHGAPGRDNESSLPPSSILLSSQASCPHSIWVHGGGGGGQIAPLPNEGTNTCEGQKKIDPWKPLPVFCIPSGIPQEDPCGIGWI